MKAIHWHYSNQKPQDLDLGLSRMDFDFFSQPPVGKKKTGQIWPVVCCGAVFLSSKHRHVFFTSSCLRAKQGLVFLGLLHRSSGVAAGYMSIVLLRARYFLWHWSRPAQRIRTLSPQRIAHWTAQRQNPLRSMLMQKQKGFLNKNA